MTTERRSLLQESLAAIERLQARLEASERALRQPIAIVGASCRYPGGVASPEGLWRLLQDGVDAVGEVPRDRWNVDEYYDSDPAAPGKMSTRRGGFMSDVDRFDAQFFGISPREATMLDPQQRLLLEVSQEALESAAIGTDRLIGSRTGVFVGITTSDYAQLLRASGLTQSDFYSATGSTLNAAAGRISFAFGFHGPCVAVDTACSSSLVSVHLACQSLRNGESNLALAGGVNLILSPEAMVLFSKWGMLSADGTCKTFDAAANGFVRAEGCGMIVLKRLCDALAEGDPVLAVIRGSAVNSDGRSSGLTVPNGLAQQEMLRTALANAGVEATDIDYVEAHGTGTSLGDPIEVEALGTVMGRDRDPGRPLLIGSIKTNIGHAESAAGIAGLLKVVMALHHEAIPPHLHFTEPNPSIAWSELPIQVPTTLTPWPRSDRPRRAGVSSFGVSGTNAHVVLEEAPARPAVNADRRAEVITLSGKTSAAVRELAASYAGFLREKPEISLADFGYTTTLGRAALAHRIAFAADSIDDTVRVLEEVAATEHGLGIRIGSSGTRGVISRRSASGVRPQVAFMFPGQGAQWAGMTRELARYSPVVRDALESCASILSNEIDVPLLHLLERGDLLDQTQYTQPAMVAVEWALAQYWRSLGVEPSAVIGHSVGEYTAACLSGVMELADGLRLIAARARLMYERTPPGAMAAVLASEDSVKQWLAAHRGLSLAAINGPENVVVAGTDDDVTAFQKQLESTGVRTHRLAVSRAFHSPLLEPMLEPFRAVARTITYRKPRLPVYSNLTGRLAGEEIATADYWVRHAREPVRFAAGIAALLESKASVLLEVGPGAVLVGMGRACNSAENLVWVPTLRKDQGEDLAVAAAVAQLWSSEVPLDMGRFRDGRGGRAVSLPTYPFQRERYWVEIGSDGMSGVWGSRPAVLAPREPTSSPSKDWVYELTWQPTSAPPAVRVDLEARNAETWLILADSHGLGDELIERLLARGDRCIRVASAEEVDFGRFLGERPTRVVHLWSLDGDGSRAPTGDSLLALQRRNCGSLLKLVQAIAGDSSSEAVQLSVVTRGTAAMDAVDLASAPVAAFARVVAQELPQLDCVSIDLGGDDSDVQALYAELLNRDRETSVAWRAGTRYVPRLIRSTAAKRASPASNRLNERATYLISGGLGGLGLEVASSFVARGARHLVLLGRRAPSDAANAAISAMSAAGTTVRVESVDVADRGALESLLGSIAQTMPPLAGIVHAAGVLEDGVILQQSWERFERVLRPKLLGAWNLHILSEHLALEFFVLFSSASTLLAAGGQSNYVAANAFLDALAQHRHARGLAAVSIAWGAWAGSGMAAALESRQQERSKRQGVAMMEPDAALGVLHDLLHASCAHVAVLDVDWAKLIAQYPPGSHPPLLDLLEKEGAAAAAPAPEAAPKPLSERLRAAPAGSEDDILTAYVRECLGAVLGMAPDRIEVDVPLLQLGLDSLMAMEVRNRIERSGGPMLPLARYLDGSDALGVARAIRESTSELFAQLERERAVARATQPAQVVELRRIARTDAMELSFGQERIWTLEQLRPDSHNNTLLRFGLEGSLNREALRLSIEAIIQRHEVLRTTFPQVDGRPVQRISPLVTLDLRTLDLSGLPEPERSQQERRAVMAEANVQFDLAAGPIVSSLLICLGAQEHVLVLVIHHIASDGWSTDLLGRELDTLYGGFASGVPATLPELPVQYVDFAHWQRRALTGAALESRREYWRNKLAGPLPVLELPFDRPRSASRSFAGASHLFTLDATLVTSLRELSRREGVTLYTTLLTALKTLLHRYSGEEDVVVGTFVAGRTRIEVERLMGFFVNTLVLRSDFSGDPSFQTALRRTRDVVLEAQANSDFPFDALVAELRPDRDANRSPFFDVVFNMQSYEYGTGKASGGLRISTLTSLEYFMVTDTLTVFAFDRKSQLEIVIVYSPEQFDAATIARLEAHFTTLLAGIVTDVQAPLSALPLLTAQERVEIVGLGQGPRVDFSIEHGYAHYFEGQARLTPTAPAVIAADGRFSYAELNERANAIASLLMAQGVAPGEPVAMCTEPGATLLSWIVGAFKAGAAYLPLDPRYPASRHAHMLRQSCARVVLASQEHVPTAMAALREFPPGAGPRLFTAADLVAVGPAGDKPLPRVALDTLAYIIFTSGSTGTPKGAMVSHRAMLNHFRAKIRALELGPADVVAQSAPIGFDISVWQFLAVLLTGGCVRVAPESAVMEPERLFDLVRAERITIAQVVPSFLRAFLDGYGSQVTDVVGFPYLRSLLLVGEALAPELARRWLNLWPEVALVNGYGPSECADEATRYLVSQPPGELDRSVAIGRPIDNVKVHVLDRHSGLMPAGCPGELCIGGAGVGLGYLNDPQRTAAAFVRDPFGAAGDRLYRTGDRARMRADGTLEFLGRLDFQVKIRGQRIELGEIEAVLERHPGVRQAIVHAWQAPSGDRLVAYVVAADQENAPGIADLREHLAAVLPQFMTPDEFVTLEQLPLNANGKVNRRALPAPSAPSTRDFVAPRTEMEVAVAAVWSEVLNRHDLSVNDNFFDMGGHSLLAAQVVARLRGDLRMEIGLRTLFEKRTLTDLASYLELERAQGIPEREELLL